MTDAPVIASADEAPALPILIVPHPVLKAKARKVLPADREAVQALIPRMFTTMYKAPGIGLAAPQIGVSLRLAVIDLMLDDKRAPVVLINPEIIAASDELATREEGCLSIPGLYADVTRPAQLANGLAGFIDHSFVLRGVEPHSGGRLHILGGFGRSLDHTSRDAGHGLSLGRRGRRVAE